MVYPVPTITIVDEAPIEVTPLAEGEERWFKFQSLESNNYQIQTASGGLTEIFVYESDRTTLIGHKLGSSDFSEDFPSYNILDLSLSERENYFIKIVYSGFGSYYLNVISGIYDLIPGGPTINTSIDSEGEGDWFKVSAPYGMAAPENYIIQTYGSTNTYMSFYGQDEVTGELFLLAEDDNSGTDNNAKIVTPGLSYRHGIYYLRVKGSNPQTTGEYSISASFYQGNPQVYSSSLTTPNLQAMSVGNNVGNDYPVNIYSISLYHNGGSGKVMLGIYSDNNGSPASLLAITAPTDVNATEGWQTVPLTSPVTLTTFSEKIWLSFIFENNPGVRYTSGTSVQSQDVWQDGMPTSFGPTTSNGYKFSMYFSYTSLYPPNLNISTPNVSMPYNSGAQGAFDITANTSWSISTDANWIDITPLTGTNDQTIILTANSSNTGSEPRIANVTINGEGLTSKVITVVQNSQSNSNVIGFPDVYNYSSTKVNLRAMPVTFSENGDIESISIYHDGGTGSFLLGVYSDLSGKPDTQLGITAITPVSAAEGWQTVALNSAVSVSSGQTVWLAWLFENSTSIRYTFGIPGRASTSGTWASGMNSTFGTSEISDFKYSIYCSYQTSSAKSGSVSPESENEVLFGSNDLTDYKIYPNPANDFINIELPGKNESNLKLSLYNLQGMILKNMFVEKGQNRVKIDISAFENGIYLIQIRNENPQVILNTSKVIKTK